MKIKTSMKVMKLYKHAYSCSYCDLQNIFHGVEPTYFNAGVYGWNCDIYTIASEDIAISTGYRNMRGTTIPYDLIKKYDAKAREILKMHWLSAEVEDLLTENRKQFIAEVLAL